MKERLHVLAAGGLLSRDMLNQISASDQALSGTSPTDYGLVQGERIGDAAARSWNRLVGIWANFRQAESRLPDTDRTATTLTRDRWLKPLLEELGFVGLPRVQAFTIDEKDYPISHEWGGSVPVHQLGWRLPVDKRTPGITGAAKTSPHSLLQEFLNRSDQHLWGIVTNGQVLRLLRDNATLTRQAYCEFDLRAIFDGNAYSDFQTLWRICHRTRFEGSPPANCHLEKWNLEAITAGTRALDQLREGVENALLELGNGFLSHRANTELRESIRNGELTADDYLRQLLRLVYRMLFLLVAESREVLLDPDAGQAAKDRYYRYYSMTRLRRLAERRRGTAHSDLWQSLQVSMNSLDSRSEGISALGLVPLGSFLWSPDTVSDIHRAQIDNRHLLAAVHHLSFTRDTQAKVPRPVDYRNLGSEELGSVYESLLELHANINGDARTFKLDTAAGSERKVTGSYYTPTALIDRLLDEALDPLLDRAEQTPHAEEALLDLRVLDPAAGSGHFLIAAAHRIAGRLATVRAGGEEPTPDQLRTALRDVIGRCVYGIDINPMAVELCKVSLWLEANHHGQPLNFLDHHIVCGNSLLGTTPELLADGIPQTAFKKPLIGDDPKRVAQLRKTNLAERKQRKQGILAFEWEPQDDIAALADDFAVINTGADTTTADVEAKAELYEDLQQSDKYRRAKLAADAWCAAFLIHKLPRQPGITDSTIRGISQGNPVNPDILASVQVLADQYQFLHLRLAFPDVFDEAGGFHLVIGNPPWDKVEFNEREFFATRQADIATLKGAARKEAIADLSQSDLELHTQYLASRRFNEGTRNLLTATGAYPLCGRGRINTYAVFAELMRNVTSPTGRTGMIVQTGIATDDTTKHFFSDLVRNRSIVSLYDFQNRKGIFPSVGSNVRFCLLTLGGRQSILDEMRFAFLANEIADIDNPDRNYALSPTDLLLVNPNTQTTPTFRNRRDADITTAIYRRVPILLREEDPDGNPWHVSFKQGYFNMTAASHLFRTRDDLEQAGWAKRGNQFVRERECYAPLYVLPMVHQFDHRWATYENGKYRDVTESEKRDPTFVSLPEFWVPAPETNRRIGDDRRWLLGWRDIARSGDRRTVIVMGHPRTGVGNNLPQFVSQESHLDRLTLLSAALNSFACDFVARQKISSAHVNFFAMRQLAVPKPNDLKAHQAFIEPRVVELCYTAWDMIDFVTELGGQSPPYQWNSERRALIRAELDALMFHLYGVNRDDADYILDTFDVLQRGEIKNWGEYRTKRLILERYDAMGEAGFAGRPYETVLDPPPAHPSMAHEEATRPGWVSQSENGP